MTEQTIRKLHAHFKDLILGNFTEASFDMTIKGNRKQEESGRISMGDMPEERKRLIQDDAQRNLELLEEKHPFLKEEKKTNIKKSE